MDTIKFLDLKAQYPQIKEEILQKFDDIMERTAFVSGKYVKEFEEQFAEYTGCKHAITVSNGTCALQVALMANNVGHSDEVIIPANTFIATAEAVSLVGAKPVLVDCNEQTYLIDVSKIEAAITNKTKAIMPVHLYGQCANMEEVLEIASKHDLIVIEDAAQAHGAKYKGKPAGSMGKTSGFSFYPGKNLGAWGEGGAITTNDDEIAEKARLIRDHGSPQKYHHDIIGGNFRMNELQGAVLSTKIKYIESWNEGRRKNAEHYKELLKDHKNIVLPEVLEENTPVWHLFVIRVQNRENFMKTLNDNEIQCGIHYPTPLHLTKAYAFLGHSKGAFPVAEKVQSEIVSLPMYAELTKAEIERVCETISVEITVQ